MVTDSSGGAAVVRIDVSLPVPAYLQIVAQMRALLVRGELAAGQRLPSVRQLATDLGVHHNTVALAYRELAEEGWLELRRGRGARVLARAEQKPESGARKEFAQRLEGLVAKAAADGLSGETIAREFEALRRKFWKGKET
jgi:GntR family transcriptional regulator